MSEACRRGGIDRTSFYEWKRRFQLQGLDGLKDLPPVAKSHPMATPAEVVERICALAFAHPAYGCNRLEAMLALEGKRVSAITIQKILNEQELGTREQRWLALEAKNAEAPSFRPSRSPSSRSSIHAFASATSRASARASCYRPTPSWSAP